MTFFDGSEFPIQYTVISFHIYKMLLQVQACPELLHSGLKQSYTAVLSKVTQQS